jgi:hypothetical protein
MQIRVLALDASSRQVFNARAYRVASPLEAIPRKYSVTENDPLKSSKVRPRRGRVTAIRSR